MLRTQRERHGVEHHTDESIGNVENGIFAEHVSDDPEPLGESENNTRVIINLLIYVHVRVCVCSEMWFIYLFN